MAGDLGSGTLRVGSPPIPVLYESEADCPFRIGAGITLMDGAEVTLIGTGAAALHHGLTLPLGDLPGLKGAFLGPVLHTYPSEMAQNFWLASFAFIACFALTLVISLATRRTKTDEELKGLVYSMTPRLPDEERHWLLRPAVLGVILLGCCVILNVIFW